LSFQKSHPITSKHTHNPNSMLSDVISVEMEKALYAFLVNLTQNRFHFVNRNPERPQKLLLYDRFGIPYNINAVIADESMRPLILIEVEFIRHNRHSLEKSSPMCTAHPALRRRYASIRSSIAVLAGSWSSSSIAMMKSHDLNVFLIPFSHICDLLAQHNINFDWDEKDRETALTAWARYAALTDEQKANIGVEMINSIKAELETLVLNILDDQADRQISKVEIELHSNLGEVRVYEFETILEAVEFLNSTELQNFFIVSDSLTLFDPPPQFEDDEV
jgi:hypothetical protein